MKRVLGLALTLALFASFTELNTAHAEEPPRAVYEALDQYFDYGTDKEQLDAALEQAGYGSTSRLFSDLPAAGEPIPTRLLLESDSRSVLDRYGWTGQLGTCGGQPMPGLRDPLTRDGQLHYLCDTRTGRWTLFRAAPIPPHGGDLSTAQEQAEWALWNQYRVDETYCYYTHPNYQGTLTLLRRAGSSRCPL